MKKNILILTLMLCTAFSVAAQPTLRSSYFMDRMPMRHKLNPALINDYGYFSMPFLGSVNVGINANVGLGNFVFPLNDGQGTTATFLHPDVSTSEFLDGLHKNNFVTQNLDMAILSFGFFGWNGYNTFDLSIKQEMGINTPKSVFEFYKKGQQGNSSYDMAGGSYSLRSYAELGLSHAHRLNDNLVIGAKLKGLFGIANAQVNFDKMNMTMNEDMWELQMKGTGTVSALGAELTDLNNLEDISIGGLGGFGMAIDLGATYEHLVEGLTISAAITDLGFISWKNPSSITVDGGTSFNGFTNLDFDDFDGSTEGIIDQITEDLESLTDTQLEPMNSSYTQMINCTLLLGGEYSMCQDKITAGLLYTSTFGTPVNVNELMVSANFAPAQWFNVALTGSVSNYGWDWGWVLNLCPRGFNFFVGMDRVLGKVNAQYIPINNANLNLNMGINFPIGKVRTGSN